MPRSLTDEGSSRLLAIAASASAALLLVIFYLVIEHAVSSAQRLHLAASEQGQALSQCWALQGAADRMLCRDRVTAALQQSDEQPAPYAQAAVPQLVRLDLPAPSP